MGHGRTLTERKQWSFDSLVRALNAHGQAFGIRWGWSEDAAQEYHRQVLYAELPTAQVSFHTEKRGDGPDARILGTAFAALRHSGSVRGSHVLNQVQRQ